MFLIIGRYWNRLNVRHFKLENLRFAVGILMMSHFRILPVWMAILLFPVVLVFESTDFEIAVVGS